jgi:hypothetical protein
MEYPVLITIFKKSAIEETKTLIRPCDAHKKLNELLIQNTVIYDRN